MAGTVCTQCGWDSMQCGWDSMHSVWLGQCALNVAGTVCTQCGWESVQCGRKREIPPPSPTNTGQQGYQPGDPTSITNQHQTARIPARSPLPPPPPSSTDVGPGLPPPMRERILAKASAAPCLILRLCTAPSWGRTCSMKKVRT